jgi:hypothetical protein
MVEEEERSESLGVAGATERAASASATATARAARCLTSHASCNPLCCCMQWLDAVCSMCAVLDGHRRPAAAAFP